MRHKALLLDRDGIINVDHGFVGQIDRFSFLPGIFDLLRFARDHGYRLVVVTNQSGVARGLYSIQDYEDITRYMTEGFHRVGIELDLVLACFYHPEGVEPQLKRTSFWRKPNEGMILEAAAKLNLDLSRSLLIGDKENDLLAGQKAGVGRCLLLSDKETLPAGGFRIAALTEALRYLTEDSGLSTQL